MARERCLLRVAGFLAEHTDKRTEDGYQRLVRHGHLPERSIMTGIGAVEVRVPRVRDRLGSEAERIRFFVGHPGPARHRDSAIAPSTFGLPATAVRPPAANWAATRSCRVCCCADARRQLQLKAQINIDKLR
jgi:hypothetical protein